jgi:hypothetical protein
MEIRCSPGSSATTGSKSWWETGLTVNHHDRHTLSGLLEVVNFLAVQADVLTVRWRHCRQSGDR